MTDSVDAQMRCVACGDALRDRGWAQYPHTIWVYPGGDEVPGGILHQDGYGNRGTLYHHGSRWHCPSMTAFVVAQMRFVACGEALRDRGWAQYPHTIGVYPGGDISFECILHQDGYGNRGGRRNFLPFKALVCSLNLGIGLAADKPVSSATGFPFCFLRALLRGNR